MCQECRQYPCHPRCPNNPDADVIGYCEKCDKPLREGDWCYEVRDDEFYCEECMDRMHTRL